MMTGLYTINLWVAGSGYVAIFDKQNIFNNSFVNSITQMCIRDSRYGEKYPGMVEELESDLRDRRDRGIFLPSGVWLSLIHI